MKLCPLSTAAHGLAHSASSRVRLHSQCTAKIVNTEMMSHCVLSILSFFDCLHLSLVNFQLLHRLWSVSPVLSHHRQEVFPVQSCCVNYDSCVIVISYHLLLQWHITNSDTCKVCLIMYKCRVTHPLLQRRGLSILAYGKKNCKQKSLLLLSNEEQNKWEETKSTATGHWMNRIMKALQWSSKYYRIIQQEGKRG